MATSLSSNGFARNTTGSGTMLLEGRFGQRLIAADLGTGIATKYRGTG